MRRHSDARFPATMKLVLLALLAVHTMGAVAPGFDPVKTFGSDRTVHFELEELTGHPFYWWPRTLLSYPVRFSEPGIKPGALRLNSGQPVPFQLSGVRTSSRGDLQFAVVSFFSDLPSGDRRRFELTASGAAPAMVNEVSETRDGDSIILDTGALKARIPGSRRVQGEAPGPILQAFRGGKWIGSSRIVSARLLVRSIETVREEAGPLFITYRVTYTFAGGGTYVARVRAVSGYDFVQLREDMLGLAEADAIHWEMSWTGLNPTHRAAPDHPFAPLDTAKTGWDRLRWERIDQTPIGTKHGVSPGISSQGELPFRLGMYEAWAAYVTLTSATFWNDRSNDAVGVFIDRVGDWQDHQYSIWWAAETLQVRYYYRDGVLTWRWPLITGSRSTGVAAYDHRKDIESLEGLESQWKQIPGDTSRHGRLFPMTYTHFLQNRYGTVDLDLVKDWVLRYPDGARRQEAAFPEGRYKSVAQLEADIRNSELAIGLMACGTRQDSGFDPVAARALYDDYVDGFQRLGPHMTPDERKRLTAWYLMLGYVAAGEDWMPLQPMLAGHPNFLADAKAIPSLVAVLFPDHPMAGEWADLFEKSLELNTRYHTRPEVAGWDAKGGRWTESLGTYVWAFLRPTVRAEFALRRYVDGKNRLSMPNIAALGDWLLNALSAPFDGDAEDAYRGADRAASSHLYWGMVTKADAPRRVYPPQGAHAARRMAPRVLWWLGNSLRNYRPMLAEYLMWAARPTDDDMEQPKTKADPWNTMYQGADNRGTNPHFKSAKYTGYGVVLRSAVDTRDEMSVHLQQIDPGPNYRWGIAAEGGNGAIYYYSRGKSYSHNGMEDVGDRPSHDTDFNSNFGVWKDGRFKSIGRNGLERPLYDLGGLQFAEIVPRQGSDAYSWPEYQSRSVMTIGADYIVTYDHVFGDTVAHRFSWFTQKCDELPFIQMVKRGSRSSSLRTSVETGEVRGVWYDGWGDAMAIISDRSGWQVKATAFGAEVKYAGGTDLIFRDPDGIRFHGDDVAFEGTAGVIRQSAGKSWEVGVFAGKQIAAGGLQLTVEGRDVGVSAAFRSPDEVRGFASSPAGGLLRVRCASCAAASVWVDGRRQEVRETDGRIAFALPSGRVRWQLTRGAPEPNAPSVTATIVAKDAVTVRVEPVAGATRFRLEISDDGARTWRAAGESEQPLYLLRGLKDGVKYHVRAIAINGRETSAPGPEHPIYATSQPPPHPDGLKILLNPNAVRASWGEVLGAQQYRLYRCVRGGSDCRVVYSGDALQYNDAAAGVIRPFARPGILANAFRPASTYTVYEYAVSAVNGNGEGAKSPLVTTDPANWMNWDPQPGEPFSRRATYNSTNAGTPLEVKP